MVPELIKNCPDF